MIGLENHNSILFSSLDNCLDGSNMLFCSSHGMQFPFGVEMEFL